MSKVLAAFAIASAILAVGGIASGQCQYTVSAVIEAPDCPGPSSHGSIMAQALNNHSHVVGYYRNCVTLRDDGFVWTPETGLVLLARPNGVANMWPADINDAGVVCGTWENLNVAGVRRGFVWWPETQTYTELDTLSGSGSCEAYAINNHNVVVGERSVGKTQNPVNAFVWSLQHGFTDLGLMSRGTSTALAINDQGEAAGRTGSVGDLGQRAFYFDGCVTVELGPIPGGLSSRANGITSSGEIVGLGFLQSGPNVHSRAFSWRNGQFLVYPPLPGHEVSTLKDINDAGVAVGVSNDIGVRPHAVLRRGETLIDFEELAVGAGDLWFVDALDVNDHGQILLDSNLSPAVVLAPKTPFTADLDDDCRVAVSDLSVLLELWGTSGPAGDVHNDQRVNVFDLLALLSQWTG